MTLMNSELIMVSLVAG